VKLKVRGALFYCGRCRKRYSNPFGHECIAPMGRRPGKTRLMPSASVTCPACHKPYGNPFTHTCTARTDFRRRTTKAKKEAAAAKRKARPEHPRPSACRDRDCKRAACAAYREGFGDGQQSGYELGREEGERVGYDRGFADGRASCPGGHK
jgi:hypothetical protein